MGQSYGRNAAFQTPVQCGLINLDNRIGQKMAQDAGGHCSPSIQWYVRSPAFLYLMVELQWTIWAGVGRTVARLSVEKGYSMICSIVDESLLRSMASQSQSPYVLKIQCSLMVERNTQSCSSKTQNEGQRLWNAQNKKSCNAC